MESVEKLAGQCPFHTGQIPEFPQPRENPLEPPGTYFAWTQAAPLTKVHIWSDRNVWLVTGYDELRAILSDPRVSADSSDDRFPGLNASMQFVRKKYQTFLSMDDPKHAQHRRMMTGEFTVKRVEALRAKASATVERLIKELIDKGPPANLSEDYSYPLSIQMMCDFVGVPYEDRAYFQDRLEKLTSSKTSKEEAAAISTELVDGYIGDLIHKKDAQPTDDVLGRLVVNQYRPGHLTFDELKAMTRMLINAGHETTANTLNMALLNLLQRPAQWEKLCRDPAIIPGAVDELLRFVDVGQFGRRRFALEDIEVAGQTIRAGEGIVALTMIANRDGRHFEDPHQLDVERKAQAQLTFGYGIHQCLGQAFARMELAVAIESLCSTFPRLRLSEPIESLQFWPHMMAYGVERVPVTW